jgi:hypothetical protein
VVGRAALILAAVTSGVFPATAAAQPPAASPFPVVQVEERRPSYIGAYLVMAAGAALIGGSFVLAERADDTYDRYLVETDEAAIEELYDQTILYDRMARGTLIGGEGLVAYGLYLRFVRRPASRRVGLLVTPTRCALAVRF